MIGQKKEYNSKDTNLVAIRAGVWFTICNILQRGIQFVYMPLYTRLLSPEGYGRYASFTTWSNILAVFATLNLCNAVFTNAMIEFKENRQDYLSSMYGLSFVTTTVSFVVMYPLNLVFIQFTHFDPIEMIFAFVGIYFQMVILLWSAYEKFEFRYKILIMVTILVSVLNPAISIALYYLTALNYFSFIIGYCAPYLLVGIALIFDVFKKNTRLYDKNYWTFAINFSLPLIPHYLSNNILSQSDRLMIKHYYGDYYTGIYTLSAQLSVAISIVFFGINNSLSPWTYRMLDEKNEKQVRYTYRRILYLGIYLSVGIMLFAPEIIEILGSDKFIEAVSIVPDLVVATYIMFLNILILNILFFFKLNGGIMVATVFGAIVNVLLNYALLPKYGYEIAGATTIVGFICIYIINSVTLVRYKREILDVKLFFTSILVLFGLSRIVKTMNYIHANIIIKSLFNMVTTIVAVIIYKEQILSIITKYRRAK